MSASTLPSGLETAHELASAPRLLRYALTRPAIVVLVAAVVGVAAVRFAAWPIGRTDTVVALAIVAVVGPMEWLIHRTLFHAPADSRRQRWLGVGVAHGHHHNDPSDLRWLLLAPSGMGVFALVLAVAASGIAATALALLGGPPGGSILTAIALAWTALLHYELTHLLIHSRCRIRFGRYRRLRSHHLAHHHRDAHRQLGVTTTLGDRLFRTGST